MATMDERGASRPAAGTRRWQEQMRDGLARAIAEGAYDPINGVLVVVGPVGHPKGEDVTLTGAVGCVNARPVAGMPAGRLLIDGFDLARPATRLAPARPGIMLHVRYRMAPWGYIVDPSTGKVASPIDAVNDGLNETVDFDAFPDAPVPGPVEPRPPRDDRLAGPEAPPGTLGSLIDGWRTAPPVLAEALMTWIGRRLQQVGPVRWRDHVVRGGLDERGHGSFAMDPIRPGDERLPWAGDVPSTSEV